MIKVNALDFLNNEKFGVEVYTESGEILYSPDEAVTPEILLMLYFKQLFVKEPISESLSTTQYQEDSDSAVEEVAVEKVIPIQKIGFDEAMANRIVEHCVEMAEMVGLDAEAINTLKQAAYYHNIGSIEMLTTEVDNPDFKKKRAQIGYKYILEKLDMPEKVARVAKSYLTSYDSTRFELNKKNKSNIPIHQIVAIASYYEEFLSQSESNEEALEKLLRLGGNKFNIYLLHKFVYKKRKINA